MAKRVKKDITGKITKGLVTILGGCKDLLKHDPCGALHCAGWVLRAARMFGFKKVAGKANELAARAEEGCPAPPD